MSANVDVLVVGAGPVGLIAALAFAQNGLSIRVVDKVSNFDNIGQRGAGLMPRSLEAYSFLGVLDDFFKKGTSGGAKGFTMTTYDAKGKPIVGGTKMWTRIEETPEIPYPNGFILGQDSNCAILRQHLKALGVEVELGTEMVNYEQDEAGVSVTLKVNEKDSTKVRAKFLLGTDGGRGITRRLAGIHFVGETKETRAIIGDVDIPSIDGTGNAVDRSIVHVFNDGDKNMALLRPIPESENGYSIFVAGPGNFDNQRLMTDIDYLNETLRHISNHPIVVTKVHTVAEWRLNERVADHFRVGRVLVAGDAAHCHAPTGGQGLNSGVLDGMNVAWKIASVVKGISPLSLLDSYEEERMPVIREMLRLTIDLAKKAFTTNDEKTIASAWQRPTALRQLGVHYRWSSIVRDELGEAVLTGTVVEPEDVYGNNPSERLHAGDRAPDAPELVNVKTGESTKLFKLFKPTHHTIVVLDPALAKDIVGLSGTYVKGSVLVVVALPQGQDAQDADADADVYTDTQGHAHRVYGADGSVKVVVVRPDGVVGGLLKGVDGVQKYFAKVFA
ncbi:hypothetical protein PENSPDRAFT_650760 [Peniophora sp. CONT]|nr:hypothetical protein PENSPDRAFT_650760 [Peniophora sp. CONT]